MTDEIRTVTDMGTLEADESFGEGSIRFDPNFEVQNVTFQLDVLGDWIRQLTLYHNELMDDIYGEDTDDTVKDIMGHSKIDPTDPNLEGRN